MAGRAIEREAVMHHCIRICFFHARHLFVTVEQRLESYILLHVFEREAPFLTKFLGCRHTLAIESVHLDVFDFVEHRHFGFAAPTPEPLHKAQNLKER